MKLKITKFEGTLEAEIVGLTIEDVRKMLMNKAKADKVNKKDDVMAPFGDIAIYEEKMPI